MNYSLDKPAKKLSDEDLNYLVEEFGLSKFRVIKTKKYLSLCVYEQF